MNTVDTVDIYYWRYAALSTADLQRDLAASPTAVANPTVWRGRLAARQLAQSVLTSRLNCSPQALQWARSVDGKPYLRNAAAPHFSYAHSDDAVLLAVTPRFELGVDLENCQRQLSLPRLLNKHFHPREAAVISRAAAPHKLALAHWCLKEASLKARGNKIAGGDLPRLCFQIEGLNVSQRFDALLQPWLCELDGHWLALATLTAVPPRVAVWRVQCCDGALRWQLSR